jgi:hypothetical protein
LADVEADPRCRGDDAEHTAAMINCLKFGKVLKETKDLSGYTGMGFWLLATESNQATSVKVSFPVPESVRFLHERFRDDGKGCDEAVPGDACFNDFATTVPVQRRDANKWVYHEVLFDELAYASWGYDLSKVGYLKFPRDRSIGIKFQVDKPQGSDFPKTDIYLDDIVLIPAS